jgi:hypothetical protein
MFEWNGCCESCGKRTSNPVMSRQSDWLVCIQCFHLERCRPLVHQSRRPKGSTRSGHLRVARPHQVA